MNNLERMKKDVERLVRDGEVLELRMSVDLYPDHYKSAEEDLSAKLPAFNKTYERWYSEALAVINVVVPQRTEDFIAYYKLPRSPKELNHSTYTISDYLKGITVTSGYESRWSESSPDPAGAANRNCESCGS
jgi:hypothetical protein